MSEAAQHNSDREPTERSIWDGDWLPPMGTDEPEELPVKLPLVRISAEETPPRKIDWS